MRRADRLIKIAHFLRSRRHAVTARTIAEEFGLSTRTVYRDINDLVDSGAPITGEAGVGYMIDQRYYLPPIAFDARELDALGLGISMVRQWSDSGFAKSALSALDKIRAVLPPDLQGELEQIASYSIPREALEARAVIQTAIGQSDLRDCIRARRKLEIVYRDEAGRASERTVWPLALIFCGPVWMVVTWCELREDFRSFRLDRMTSAVISDFDFPDDPARNLAAFQAQDSLC